MQYIPPEVVQEVKRMDLLLVTLIPPERMTV